MKKSNIEKWPVEIIGEFFWIILFFRLFHTFSVSGAKVSGKHVTQGFSPDSSLRARGPYGSAAALKG